MLKEFKDFAMRGNVMDLAVAVVLGGAFGSIVTSLVNDIIMPIIGMLIGDSFATLSVTVNGVAIKYGAFIQAVVNFVLIAFAVFIVIKLINSMKKKKKEEVTAEPAGPTVDQQLLMEIRDALNK